MKKVDKIMGTTEPDPGPTTQAAVAEWFRGPEESVYSSRKTMLNDRQH